MKPRRQQGCGSGSDEYHTPPEYIASVKAVMGRIDTDPASNDIAQQSIQAKHYFTVENSALAPDAVWQGKVWCNPPYSHIIKEFVKKFVEQGMNGTISEAIWLTNAGTDTKWAHELLSRASVVCFTKGRIGFISGQTGKRLTQNNKGQMFIYFGPNTQKFIDEFCQYGLCLIPNSSK